MFENFIFLIGYLAIVLIAMYLGVKTGEDSERQRLSRVYQDRLDDNIKYEMAYRVLLNYWDSLPDQAKKDINKELNQIFGKDHPEYTDNKRENMRNQSQLN